MPYKENEEVLCVRSRHSNGLTYKKWYRVVRDTGDQVLVVNDSGGVVGYSSTRFQNVVEAGLYDENAPTNKGREG